jgi:hypothetical protein
MKAIVKQVHVGGKFGILELTESSGNRFDICMDAVDVVGGKLAIGQRYEITFTVDLTNTTGKGTI